MVPNHLELELLAKVVHESRVREADARRLIESARDKSPETPRTALFRIVSTGSRVRWWFRSRSVSPQTPAESAIPLVAAELASTISLDTVSAAGALLPADSYEALMIIARGRRQRHERLVSRCT